MKARILLAAMGGVLLSACAHIETTAPPITVLEPPLPAVDQRAAVIHAEILVLDAHADIALPTTSKTYLGADGRSKVEPVKLRAGGVGAVVMSAAVGPGPRTPEGDAAARAEVDEKIAALMARIDASEELVLATTVEEITAAHAGGKLAMILGFQNARAFEGRAEAVDEFYAQGARVFGLTHLAHNDFADSSRPLYNGETGEYEATEEHGGLSDLGRAAIDRMNALGGVLDVSQMSKAATLQAIEHSTTPVIASHSNVRMLSDVTRNLSDEEIDRIGETGGVIHVAPFGAYLVDISSPERLAEIKAVRLAAGLPEAYSYPYELYWELDDPADQRAFLTAMRDVIGTGDVARMVDHIDYVVERIGIDHVGIGTDFNHGSGIAGFVDASEALGVTTELVTRGYEADEIEKIWSGNFLRVLAAAEAAATDGT